MKLYHGTSSKNAERIRLEGIIRPRFEQRGNYEGAWQSRPQCVYLTTNLEMAINYTKNNGIVFEVDVPWQELKLDEDEIDNAIKFEGAEGLYPDEVVEILIKYRNKLWERTGIEPHPIHLADFIEQQEPFLVEELKNFSQSFCLPRFIRSYEIVDAYFISS